MDKHFLVPGSDIHNTMLWLPIFSAAVLLVILGAIGVWFDWGLVGVVAFFIGSHIACRPAKAVSRDYQWPLVLTGCLMAGYGCIAPVIFYPSGATYFAMLLGLWLASLSRVSHPLRAETPRMQATGAGLK